MTDECMQTQMQTICILVRKIFVIQFTYDDMTIDLK